LNCSRKKESLSRLTDQRGARLYEIKPTNVKKRNWSLVYKGELNIQYRFFRDYQ